MTPVEEWLLLLLLPRLLFFAMVASFRFWVSKADEYGGRSLLASNAPLTCPAADRRRYGPYPMRYETMGYRDPEAPPEGGLELVSYLSALGRSGAARPPAWSVHGIGMATS